MVPRKRSVKPCRGGLYATRVVVRPQTRDPAPAGVIEQEDSP